MTILISLNKYPELWTQLLTVGISTAQDRLL